METFQEILGYIAAHSVTLGIGTVVGLILEHTMSPVSRVRTKLASMFGAAEDAIKE